MMIDRLPERIRNKIYIEPNTGCWLWMGALSGSDGYGMSWLNGKVQRAHRVVYRLIVGEIPNGLELDHLCRTRCCCNPKHLEPVTRSTNNKRGLIGMKLVFNHNRIKTHCAKGHPLSGNNLYVYPEDSKLKGFRVCRRCHRDSQLRYIRKKHENGAREYSEVNEQVR